MASLKEIKGRIGSVKSTLKITSAMKMVASSRLHKAQLAIDGMRPYEQALSGMLDTVISSASADEYLPYSAKDEEHRSGRVAVIAASSNSSLCGAFNNNVIKETRRCISRLQAEGYDVDVYALGKKMADAMQHDGHALQGDYSKLVGDVKYDDAAALADKLTHDFVNNRYDKVVIVYNHLISMASQEPKAETLLPVTVSEADRQKDELIFEPSADEILRDLLPKMLRLKVFTTLLDSVASEHSARTVAMQTATDNAERILAGLTLEYNKSRQQKITGEILDIIGGSQQ